MGKLRVVEVRKSEGEHEFDLRGLGEDPVHTQAFPFSVLAVRGASHGLISKLFGRHGFQVVHEAGDPWTFVREPNPQAGNHKVTAVKLFTALIASGEKLKDATIHLFEVSQLEHRLWAAIQGHPQPPLNDVLVGAHGELEKPCKGIFLKLEQHTVLHLKQAGFPVPESGMNPLSLSRDEYLKVRIRALHDAQTAETASERKVA